MSGIPEWAEGRAFDLFKTALAGRLHVGAEAIWRDAFARYIAAHEQPPVDPIRAVMHHTFGYIDPIMLAKFHVELVKHGLQIISTGATK